MSEYWEECLSQAADEIGLKLTSEQLAHLAQAAENAHDNHGSAFYSPPSSDIIAANDREWQRRLDAAQSERETDAERAKRDMSDMRHSLRTARQQRDEAQAEAARRRP